MMNPPSTYTTQVERETLDQLLRPHGPATTAWLSRTHHELIGRYPDRCVMRLRHRLKDLVAWLRTEEVPFDCSGLSVSLGYDEEEGGTRPGEEGGCLAFNWAGDDLLAFGLRVWGTRKDETYTWIVGPSRAAIDRMVLAMGKRGTRGRSLVHVFTDGYWEEATSLGRDLGSYTWDQLILPEAEVARLRRTAETFFSGQLVYRDLGIPWKLGMLLMGPPGTGKTTATKVLAANCGVPFLFVRALSSGCAPDADDIHTIFQGARERAPCILCLEDVDGMITENLRSAFLNELDGLDEQYRGVLTVATTNHPEKLDPALLFRPCRFDYRFEFPLPDAPTRQTFVERWMTRLVALDYVSAATIGVEEIVRDSDGMSQAYLKRLLISAVTQMHSQGTRGDEAFLELVRQELADVRKTKRMSRRITGAGGAVGIDRGIGFLADTP